jgi:GntR family transcriptional regulator of arabinose operon
MQIKIDHNSTIPLHIQLLDQLRHFILSGQWPPGSRIPSETTLQYQLNISRSTIRQALHNAEADGLIERVPGKGTFVSLAPANSHNLRLIGYVTVDFLSSDFQYQLLSGAETAAKARGYRIVFCNSNNDAAEEDRLLNQLLQDKVGGILIWPILNDDPGRTLFQLALQDTLPLVLVDRTFPNLTCDFVTSKNYTGAYTAVQHLIKLGHQRIVFLSHPFVRVLPVAERLRGYKAALQDANLEPLEPQFISTSHEVCTKDALDAYRKAAGSEIEQIVRYLENPARPTAIFAVNDLVALLTLKAASLVGLHIPGDLSVVGFDDLDIVAHVEVPLTTVAQNAFALGKCAAELLIDRIEGYSGPPRREYLPTQLRARASTAAPAASSIVAQRLSESTEIY